MSPDCRPSSDSYLRAAALLEYLGQRIPPFTHCHANLRNPAHVLRIAGLLGLDQFDHNRVDPIAG